MSRLVLVLPGDKHEFDVSMINNYKASQNNNIIYTSKEEENKLTNFIICKRCEIKIYPRLVNEQWCFYYHQKYREPLTCEEKLNDIIKEIIE